MPTNVRNSILAIGLILLATTHAYAEGGKGQPDANQSISRSLSDISAKIDEQAERSRRADQDEALCGERQYGSRADLCAQWKAADSASDSAWWAWVAAVSTMLSTVAVVVALGLTHKSNGIARDTAKRQLAAYLSLESAEVRISPRGPSIYPRIRNDGDSPARNVRCEIDMEYHLSGGWDPESEQFQQFQGKDLTRIEDFGIIPRGAAVEMSFAMWMVANPSPSKNGIPGVYAAAGGILFLHVYGRGSLSWTDVFDDEHIVYFSVISEKWQLSAPKGKEPTLTGSGVISHNDSGFDLRRRPENVDPK